MQQRTTGRLSVLKKRLLISGLSLMSVLGAASLMTGCAASVTIGDSSTFTAISAGVSTLRVNQTTQLATHTQFDGTSLAFYVNGILGGNSEVGTISSTGLYSAPAIVPVPNNATITSVATAHPDYPQGAGDLESDSSGHERDAFWVSRGDHRGCGDRVAVCPRRAGDVEREGRGDDVCLEYAS